MARLVFLLISSLLLYGSHASAQGLQVEANAYLQSQNLAGSAQVARKEGTVTISIAEANLFQPGSADVRGDARQKLLDLADLLTANPYLIRVEGHTDNVPIRGAQFRSNWQLSATRAANIVEMLVREQKVPPDRISAVGLADSRPVADNQTAAGRAKNRRIAIVLEPLSEK